jgi:hypothetical protein
MGEAPDADQNARRIADFIVRRPAQRARRCFAHG